MNKKLVQINIVCNGSTGKIMCDIAKEAEKEGYETYCFYGRGKPNKDLNCIKIGNIFSLYWHLFITLFFDKHGHGSFIDTLLLIKKIKAINPDIIHMHNIHGYYINIGLFFKYLKKHYQGQIIWTLHDCWTFTGHCAHFSYINCNKWKDSCYSCPQKDRYPKSKIFDCSKKEYLFKKELFTNINNLTIITPSMWLANLVKESFLKNYKVYVINNGIDTNIFMPQEKDINLLKKYNISETKKIILGVASCWVERKGLSTFFALANSINYNEYQIIMVGLTLSQIKQLPKNIIGIERTDNQKELAKLYSLAWVFLNPSKEDTSCDHGPL